MLQGFRKLKNIRRNVVVPKAFADVDDRSQGGEDLVKLRGRRQGKGIGRLTRNGVAKTLL